MLLCNSLPELGDGGGEVGGVSSQPKGFVLAVGVFNAAFSVPGLFALGPGQLRLKTLQTPKQAGVTYLHFSTRDRMDHPRRTLMPGQQGSG